MSNAFDEAYARYKHIVHPSAWDRLLDLCLGKGLADRLHYARLEKAQQQSVQAQRARGEFFELPAPRQEPDEPQDTEESSGNQETAPAGLTSSPVLENEDDSYFEPFFWDGWSVAFPPAHQVFKGSILAATAPESAPEVTHFPNWKCFEWNRRRLQIPKPPKPLPPLTEEGERPVRYKNDTVYGFKSAPDLKKSNLSRMIHAPESVIEAEHEQCGPEKTENVYPARPEHLWPANYLVYGDDSGCAMESWPDNEVPEEFLHES